jgi:RHS repeat-associated protein
LEAEAGLYFYNARWYDPALGRLAQADTIVPQQKNPMAWDRYAGMYNNPIKYNDPTGNCPICIIAWIALNAEAITVGVIAAFGLVTSAISAVHHIEQKDYSQAIVDVAFGSASIYVGHQAASTFSPLRTSKSVVAKPVPSISPQQNEFAPEYQPGTFSIRDWSGYPDAAPVPKPSGPFRLLTGDEYKQARVAADNANSAIHALAPNMDFKVHEIQPVKFGGSPTDPANKILLTPNIHNIYTQWWRNIQKCVEQK